MPTPPITLKAFIIGPIGDRDEPDGSSSRLAYEEAVQILEEVILPACSAFGIEAIRADQISRTGEIPEQIFRQLRDAPLVIADLTGANPNVMYELGLRHTTGKLTVQIGERERLPFDVASIRTIMFKRTDGGLVEARRKLSQILASGLQFGGDPVAATRVWFEAGGIAEIENAVETFDEEQEKDEPGFLEILAESEEATQSLTHALSTAFSITEDITRLFTESTAKAKALDANGGTSAARLALANRVASLLDEPASRLQVTAGEYAQSVLRMEPGVKYMLMRLAEDPSQLLDAPEFPNQMRMLITAAESSISGALKFKETIDNMGNAARSLRQVGKKISAALQSLADSSARVASWKELVDRLP